MITLDDFLDFLESLGYKIVEVKQISECCGAKVINEGKNEVCSKCGKIIETNNKR